MLRQPVQSSSLSEVGYENGQLEVRFASGQVYRYADVPADVHAELLKAKSIGRAFQALIRGGGFAVEKVVEEAESEETAQA